ncbi:hypothetical protein BDZ94DRAFT_1265694 [Collybia nuda]|uniref:Uncharacterized protein n=1 Tax=Collybia nuda TaxID=64659 RepID=A0A9P5Y1N7_9AGAR|nr:hypothetical protein BDZ94DRAFT_1265694 [Collybia nuda]
MYLPPSTIYNIWQFAPCLKSCSFAIRDFDHVPASPSITIPALESLQLVAYDFDWEDFLDVIKTPSLKNLSIEGSHVPAAPLTSLITRSGCSIREFHLFEEDENDTEMGSDVFHSFFQHLLTVSKFSVSWCLPTSAIWSIRDGNFPNLLSAGFSVCPEAFDALLDMVDSYVDQSHYPGRRLGCFDIVCYVGPGFTDVRERYKARYKAYEKAEGLSITAVNDSTGALLQEEDSDDGSTDNESSDEDDWE